jgi:hypothetical protein
VSLYAELIWMNRTIGMFGDVRYGCGPPIDGVFAEPGKR